jgi:GTP-binding protein EngB required for normal cell division
LILLIDARRGAEAEELWFKKLFRERQGMVVLTKADKLTRRELDAVVKATAAAFDSAPGDLIVTSADKRQGLEELLTWIGELVFE